MHKLYTTLIACTAICATGTVNAQTLTVSAEAPRGLETVMSAPKTVKATEQPFKIDTATPARMKSAPGFDIWLSAGTATVHDGVLDAYRNMRGYDVYTAEMQHGTFNSKWYRIKLWPEGSAGATELGKANDAYAYFNTADPAKVYCPNFDPWGYGTVSQMVPDNNWADDDAHAANFGTLADGIISFPACSFGAKLSPDTLYNVSDKCGRFKIYMSGAKDQSLEFITEHWCADAGDADDANLMKVQVDRGTDVATVKYLYVLGHIESTYANDQKVATTGKTLDKQYNALNLIADRDEPYTLMGVSLDAAGNIVDKCYLTFFGVTNDNSDWEDFGEAEIDRNLFVGFYNGAVADTERVKAERSISTPGKFRLVNPYASYTGHLRGAGAATHPGHDHYIIINATDPMRAYVEMEPLGYDYNDGEALLGSFVAYALANNSTPDDKYYGTLTAHEFTMPAKSLVLGQKYHDNGKLYFAAAPMHVTFEKDSSIDGLTAAGDATVSAPEYFNLQGQPMANPAPGQMVIVRQAGKVSKQIIR